MLQTLSNISDAERRIDIQLQKYTTELNQGIATINEMGQWYKSVDDNKLSIHILNLYELSSNYIQEVQDLYGKILRHIYELLSPVQVTAIIADAQEKLAPILKIKTVVVHKEKEILIQPQFPITEITTSDPVKVTSIPINITNSSYLVIEQPHSILEVDYNTSSVDSK
ncbi:hypothetical protein HHI36_006617 [Cryptolaemus montrouzieri]|uniref:Uncharacterized protein n=1 Tax=Cryptolaemus montrouzieri TaxID=559131 RepID=A0ABD2NXM2_9CUCU